MPTSLSNFFFASAMMLLAVPSAFAQVTTFNVDMSCAPAFDNVFVTGPWCGWCANEVYNTMTDPDGDGIYSVTLDETVTGTIEYKYAINGFMDQENLVNDMIDGASCAPITDYNVYANRQTQQGSTTNDYYGTCDGTCNDFPPASVTFHVDMSGYEGPYDPSQVTWNGPANGWCGNCYPMVDLDGDGIYSITLELEGDSIEYKFAIGAWDDEEDLEPESSCTRTTYDQDAPNGCCFVNRVVSLLGEESIDLPVVCWNECTGCGPEFTLGCTNESACNYNADATEDDGSCFECPCNADFVFPGDVTFGLSPDPANGETFAVGYLGEFYADILHFLVPTSADELVGIPVPVDSLVIQNISLLGESGEALIISDVGIELTPNNNGDSGNPNAFLGGSQYCATLTGTPDTTGFFIASIDVVAWASFLGGPISQDLSFEGYTLNLCSSQCLGCTDLAACNYEAFATLDDGSCEYESCIEESLGCTDVVACNYEAVATLDDGSCEYESCIGGNVLFYESFSNGFDGSNGNGAWTVNDNQDGRLWIWVAPDGQGFYPDGEATGSTHPGGAYSTNIGPLESTTAGNGWVIYDNDFWHGGEIDANNPAVDNEGTLTSPSMDFSNNGSVIVSWETYFRYCCYPYAPVFLEVGITENGVTSWTTFDAHGDFIESANAASANPLSVSVDVSCVAAYQNSVQLRFAYRQAPESGQSYSHYYWGIDDVTVTSNNVANDLEITQVTNGDVFSVWEYRLTPFEQAIEAADGGLVAGVMYKNVGLETQYGVDVLVEILDENGISIFSITETIDTVHSYAQAPTCPANTQDTLYVQTGWEPDAPGDFSLRISLMNGVDATPLNNVLAKDFFYTEDVFGHDNEAVLDTTELGPRESDDIPGFYDPTGYGSYYHCPNPGSVAYGIAVTFGPNTGLNASGGVEPFEFTTRLYTLDGSATITDSPFDEAYWVFNTPPNPTGDPNVTTYLAFDDPIDLGTWSSVTGGNFYFAGVMSEFESAAQLTVLAEPNSDTDSSTGVYSVTGAGDFVWFTSQTATPAIRLITGPFHAGCTDVMACNYDPTAEFSDGSCLFVGQQCNDGLVTTFNDVVDENCQCQGVLPQGCIDPMACNYDPSALESDGSCDYTCLGCTDAEAFNYDPAATVDDGTCVYFVTSCEFIGHPAWAGLEAGLFSDSTLWHYQGTEAFGEWVLHMPELVVEPGSGSTYAVMEWSNLTMSNMPPGLQPENMPSVMTGGEQVCVSYSGIPSEVGLYPVLVSGELTISLFGSPYVVGPYNVVGTIEVLPNPNPVAGCTYGNAANYVVYANVDDGSCVFAGCTEEDADNYQPLATVDDGTCVFGECEALCPADINGDGAVNTNDLLGLLGYFGLPCEE